MRAPGDSFNVLRFVLMCSAEQLTEWPDRVRLMQKHWIGRSQGLTANFKLATSGSRTAPPASHLTVYTTRPDTIHGVTFVAIAPDHPLIDVRYCITYGEHHK